MNESYTQFKIDYANAKSKPEAIIQGNTYRITILTERLIRLEYSKEGQFFDSLTEQVINRNFPVPKFKFTQDEKKLEIETSYFKLKYLKEKPFESYNMEVQLKNTDKSWSFNNKEVRNFKTSGSGFVNGKLTYEKGLYSVDGFVSIDDSKSMVFTPDGYLEPPTTLRTDIYLWMYRRDFGYCLKDYFMLTGYPMLLPKYALGIWWNKNEVYSMPQIEDLVQKFAKNEIPLSIILLNENWHIKDKNNPNRFKTGYTFNTNLFPDPNYLAKYLHQNGIKLGLEIDPSEGIMPHEDDYETIAKKMNLMERSTIPFNIYDRAILENYFKVLLKNLRKKGVDFFAIEYQKANTKEEKRALIHYHYMEDCKNSQHRGFQISENLSIAPHRTSVLNSGKDKVDFATLAELPFYNSLASNKGISWWSHAIGGYEQGIEQAELYSRYVQFGCFSPIFRFSSQKGKYYKREPWLWDIKTKNIVRDYTQLRQRLIPYLYTENYKYHKTGLPIIQPLFYTHPEIYDEPKYKNEYHFGTELLVAPITTGKDFVMNRTIQHIFLPQGMWYDFKTGKKFPGNKRYVTFYKDHDYPVFAKSGSIIPLSILSKKLNDLSIPQKLEIHIFPGKSNIYNLYEDDGESAEYQMGEYAITAIDYNYLQNNYTVIIHPLEGNLAILPPTRDYKIRFRNTRKADDVIVYQNQEIIDKICYVEDTDFIVEVKNVSTKSQLTINCKGRDIEIDAVRLINEEIDSIINDLPIETTMKETLAEILFSEIDINKKRIELKKLKRKGLDTRFIRMLIRVLEYAQ